MLIPPGVYIENEDILIFVTDVLADQTSSHMQKQHETLSSGLTDAPDSTPPLVNSGQGLFSGVW